MNILTFDIEEWYLRRNRYANDASKYDELNRYLDAILNLLALRRMKATFFCLGMMAKSFPGIVRKIDGQGHEVGCHSNSHIWLNKMSKDEVREDTRISIDSLQQCIGKKVKSYRAPAFSIGENNKWAFDILAENGIERDASIFPAARDFGGFPNFGYKTPVIIQTSGGNIVKEFPICTTNLLGKDVAYSGGGYFRFFPLWYVKKVIKRSDYVMTYFHISDLMPESDGLMTRDAYENYYKESGTIIARYKRFLKSNIRKGSSFKRLLELIKSEDFVNLEQADDIVEWKQHVLKM